MATLPKDSGILIPGYWMLFVMDRDGVPSIAKENYDDWLDNTKTIQPTRRNVGSFMRIELLVRKWFWREPGGRKNRQNDGTVAESSSRFTPQKGSAASGAVLEEAVVRVYAWILKYLVEAKRYFEQETG
ncbi:hypothetical protein N7516_005657, partial [Penicillium verrucosum]|uniref:uncharacterized protein n=1 Tax=Penicillium verrucosum TaxID=60171 RepID=UPI002544ED94